MADIQFDINLDLVEKYVPAENVTVVQEDYQSVKFHFTITNREQPVDLTGATDIVVSFVKPDGHLVLQNDATLVNGKVELIANPQAFTYVGKTYFQVQYKIGAATFNTRQAFLWVEKGHTSCQTVSSTDFAPMLDQAIQAGNMLSGIDLQALIDSKVTAENAQKDVDNLEIRVGALEVTIVGLSSRVSALEASQVTQDTAISGLQATQANHTTKLGNLEDSVNEHKTEITSLQNSQATQDTKISSLETGQVSLNSRVASVEGNITTVVSEVDALQLASADHESRIDGLEASMPNLSPIQTDITSLKAKDVQQDGRIGANELSISAIQTKNTQQDTAIAGNATEIANLQAKDIAHETRMAAIEAKNVQQDDRLTPIEVKNTNQDTAIAALQGSQATQDTKIAAIETKNTQQDTAIAANATSITTVDNKVTANKTAQDTINTSTAGSIANHASRITTLEVDSNTDNARITNLEMDNSSNKTRIATVEGAVGILNKDINALQGSDAVQTADITAIKTKNTQQDVAISDNTAAITANKTDADAKITGLTTRVGTNETDITALKAKDVTHETRMSAIENKNNAQDTRMDTIEGVNTTQNNRLGTLETDNTNNKSRLTTLETDNTSNKSRLTTVENKNTSQDTDIAGKVSKSGDTMTGDLKFDKIASGARYAEWNVDGVSNFKQGINSSNNFVWFDTKNNSIPMEYKLDTRTLQVNSSTLGGFQVNCDTNLVKKADIYTDLAKANGDATLVLASGQDLLTEILNAGRGFRTVYAPASATGIPANKQVRGFSNLHGTLYGYAIVVDTDNRVWSNFINGGSWLGWKCITGNDKDDRVTLTLTADATNINAGFQPTAVRRGNSVTVRMHIKRTAGSTGNIVTTLPVGMRPVDSLVFYVLSLDGAVVSLHIGSNGEISVYTADKDIKFATTFVVD